MKMTSRLPVDVPLLFPLKREREEVPIEDIEDDASLEDINNLLSMPLPSLSSNRFVIPNDSTDEFLRLTTMVRAVYFSYLQKCLLNNYILCYKDKYNVTPSRQLKKCADEMELNAVKYSLEATVYRRNMLKLISDIKAHTSDRKTYKKLTMFLETPAEKVDVAVQTDNSLAELERLDNIQSVCITSNYEEFLLRPQMTIANNEQLKEEEMDESPAEPNVNGQDSPTVNSSNLDEAEEMTEIGLDEGSISKMDTDDETVKIENNVETFSEENSSFQAQKNQSCIQNEDENSQDSLMQHMEDMFCESDDSSDLTTLIEKHSGVTKANIDKEINKICQESGLFLSQSSVKSTHPSTSINKLQSGNSMTDCTKDANTGPAKVSLRDYKEMRNREAGKASCPEPESAESKQRQRVNNIWFVERVHQVSKLNAIMTELSLRNYRKHGRIKQKFIELFGESDEDEMMPDSPICIEEHLTACKERIAPWIVKHLMPYYKKRRIKDRPLFKTVAKHIADMLIIEDTFPEEEHVGAYIDKYFKNKKLIKTKQDIYM